MPLPPNIAFIYDRGPFDAAAELRLFAERKVEIVVSKNSGGSAAYGKIEAARQLGLPVVMIERPEKPAGHTVASAKESMRWLEARLHGESPSRRGV